MTSLAGESVGDARELIIELRTVSGATTSVGAGIKWTYLSTVISGLLQVLLLSIMARLVSPEEFGILTTALLALKALQVLIQSGYERAVVWVDNPDRACLAGLFWISMLTGGFITLAIVVASGPIASIFSEPRLQAALIALSPMAVLAAPGLVPNGLLRRNMRFRALGLYELASYVIAFVGLGLPLAIFGYGLWALVAANLLQCLLQGSLALILEPPPAFTRFGWKNINNPLRFGFGVSGLGIIEFIDRQATQIFIGRIYGMATLGIYNRSSTLIQLPLEQMGTSLTRVLFPLFNRARGNSDQLRSIAVTPLRVLAILVFPVALGGGAVADTLTEVMLGAGWNDAGPLLSALCVGAAAGVLGNFLATMNESMSLIRQKTVVQILITSILLLLLVSFGGKGVILAAVCFSFTRILFLFAQIWLAAPQVSLSRLTLSAAMLPGFALGVAVAGLLFGTDMLLQVQEISAGFRLLMLILAGVIVSFTGAWIVSPEFRILLLQQMREAR